MQQVIVNAHVDIPTPITGLNLFFLVIPGFLVISLIIKWFFHLKKGNLLFAFIPPFMTILVFFYVLLKAPILNLMSTLIVFTFIGLITLINFILMELIETIYSVKLLYKLIIIIFVSSLFAFVYPKGYTKISYPENEQKLMEVTKCDCIGLKLQTPAVCYGIPAFCKVSKEKRITPPGF